MKNICEDKANQIAEYYIISLNLQETDENIHKKIKALAKKLNYQPNHYAAGLRSRRSNTIAVVVPEVADK